MKTLIFSLGLVLFLPLAAWSQSDTYHDKYENEYEIPFGEWTAYVHDKVIINEVITPQKDGSVEIRYTSNLTSKWVYVNQVTGQVKQSPFHQNVTGVFTPNGALGFTDDYRVVSHYVNDPIFGAYHVVVKIYFQVDFSSNPPVIQIIDVKNEWFR